MNINQLEKANKIVENLKELDKKVVKIEKLAQQVANNDCNISINIEDFSKKKEEKEKVKFDEDGSLSSITSRYASGMGLYNFMNTYKTEEKSKDIEINSFDITDVTALNILGFMLLEINEQRKVLLNSLEQMKIKV